MILYDLKRLLFLLLLSYLLVALITFGFMRWWEQRRRLANVRQRLQATLEHAPVGIFFFDGNEEYIYANLQARRLLQLAGVEGRIPDAPWIALLDEDIHQLRHDSHHTGRHRTLLLPLYSSAGGHPQSMLVQWWVTRWDQLYLIFVIDQSAKKRLEEQTNLLVGRLAHELRTPLASIQTHAEILMSAEFAEPVYARSVAFLRSETARLLHLTNRALELARLTGDSNLELQPIHLLPLVEEVVTQLTPQAEATATLLTIEAAANLPPVLADGAAIKQVLLNLVENALKHGGPENKIVIRLIEEEAEVVCHVRDRGVGIEERHLPYLTDPFYRVIDTATGGTIPNGTGLGLALVAEILRRHQSQLRIESKHQSMAAPGAAHGTNVSFTLPTLSSAII